MYKVVRAFLDSADEKRLYKVGDVYPAEGVKPNKKRIDELATGTNSKGKVYIEEVNTHNDDEGNDPPGTQSNE